MTKIGCVLLAGGLATRMGGGDKGLKQVDGKAILDRVLDCIKPQTDVIVINANGEGSRFDSYGLPVVSDSVEGFVGPLAGILAGMDALNEYSHILSVPTDTPFLPDDLVAKLYAPIEKGEAAIVLARSGGYDHPVVGIWPTALREDLRKALVEEDIRKLKKWISRYSYATVEWSTDPVDPFFNANSPEDIAASSQLIAQTKDR
ncbi:molybdenum cofactor guanylyltransferase MobA [Terasakiella sp. A23]|uniref:molybdenum cofactor guanylyltransferase MobA n=1 Tax=Terasakiella sp. FCG-A23 TaxID=3080561 RepID=UPI0029556844|nr:molybdenum cofactor guanylyltransferase MobA [Terasakiella sp. A23]MDV7339154.1 molybdenum cofactor guanylyltransferase MobA [Terasakiella sp. A23]